MRKAIIDVRWSPRSAKLEEHDQRPIPPLRLGAAIDQTIARERLEMNESMERAVGSVTREFMVPNLAALDDPRVLGLEAAIRRREAILNAVSYAAARFLGNANWDSDIREVLARLGSAAEVSRVYLFAGDRDEGGTLWMRLQHEWVTAGLEPFANDPQRREFAPVARGLARWAGLEHGDVFYGPVSSFPPAE